MSLSTSPAGVSASPIDVEKNRRDIGSRTSFNSGRVDMPDVVIHIFRDRVTLTGDSRDGCLWLVNNTEVPVVLSVHTELAEELKALIETAGLSVEVK